MLGPLEITALLFAAATGLGLAGGLGLMADRLGRRRRSARERRLAALCFLLLPLEGAAFLWGLLVEPRWPEITFTEVDTPRLPRGERLRVVHLTDFHAEGSSPVLEGLPERVNALKPDLLVFTGDTLNSAEGLPVVKDLLARIEAPLGRFAAQGNQDVAYRAETDLFGGVAVELTGEPQAVGDGRAVLCGAPYPNGGVLERCLRASEGRLRIVAYHTPDLVEDLAPLGPDLYLAGHTHGGQVRVPLYGAVVTMSELGKRYEMGRYTVGSTALYVNRGVGMEGGLAPRVRFLCRPEIAVIDLVGSKPAP